MPLKVHRDNGELLSPIFCRQSGCKSCFSSLSNFFWHVNCYHVEDNHQVASTLAMPFNHKENVNGACDDEFTLQEEDLMHEQSADFFEEFQIEAVSLAASFRANSG
jgi:hypothetical protein